MFSPNIAATGIRGQGEGGEGRDDADDGGEPAAALRGAAADVAVRVVYRRVQATDARVRARDARVQGRNARVQDRYARVQGRYGPSEPFGRGVARSAHRDELARPARRRPMAHGLRPQPRNGTPERGSRWSIRSLKPRLASSLATAISSAADKGATERRVQ